MSEGIVSPRKTRSRVRIEEDSSGLNRFKEQDGNLSKNATKSESESSKRSIRKRPLSDFRDFQNESGTGETESGSERSFYSDERPKKLHTQSVQLLIGGNVGKTGIMQHGRNQNNYDDDAVDVVNSNDDSLAELDVGTSATTRVPQGFENRQKEGLGSGYHYDVSQSRETVSTARRGVFRGDGTRFGYDASSCLSHIDRKPVPAAAPLLTTERTHIRIAKRKQDETPRQSKEKRQQERELFSRESRNRNMRTSRYYYSEDKTMMDDDVDDAMYAEIDIGDSDFIEATFEDDELIYENADLAVCDAENEAVRESAVNMPMRNQSVQQGSQQEVNTISKQDDIMVHVNEGAESNDDEAPPELEPQSPTLTKDIQRADPGKDLEAEYVDGEVQIFRVQTPNGTEQFIQLAPGQCLEDDNTLFMAERDNETGGRQDLRAVEFNFLDSKNICCGLCGEIVLYDLLLSSHIPQHHPEVLEEGVTAFEDVPYEVWLREKLREEKRRMENSMNNIYDDILSSHNSSGRVYRTVSTIRVNPNEMTLNQLITALRKKMFEKLGRSVPVSLVDKQHARCGICNAVVSLNRKFEVVHLVRHFNAWHPSLHQCAGKWKLRKPQPGMGKPLSIQDFAVIDTALDRGANIQCIWCGMFMTAEALAMHFSEVHPEEIEVPKCNLCLQELVINARLLEKFGDEFDISMPDEHRIKCGKYGTTHTSEARLHAAIEKRLKLCEDGQGADSIENEDEEEVERTTTYVNSRMTFGRRSKPKRQFIMPALRQAAPVNSRFVEAVNDCHWKCKICKGDILAAVISAGAIRHFRTEHPHQLHNMQYELCKTRLERISDGCMEFINPQLIECLVCNMTYMLHRPFNMCRAIRHLRSKHPDLMPEFATILDSGQNLQRKQLMRSQEHPEGLITDPATIAMLRAQYGVDFQKVQALKGANGEPVYVLLDEGDDIDPETAIQLAASVAAGDFDQVEQETRPEVPAASENAEHKRQVKLNSEESRKSPEADPSYEKSNATNTEQFIIASD